ncbi:hypothetical protein [Micromonospora sp. LOL_024]|uniref:hypothetical protein n=1 Tax=Micromonospora sp. LOL_024 TaxID=3345412 RepID=UPI003A854709
MRTGDAHVEWAGTEAGQRVEAVGRPSAAVVSASTSRRGAGRVAACAGPPSNSSSPMPGKSSATDTGPSTYSTVQGRGSDSWLSQPA